MSRIPLKYHTNIKVYRQYTHPMLICRGTHGRTNGRTDGRTDGLKIFTQYSGISSSTYGSKYLNPASSNMNVTSSSVCLSNSTKPLCRCYSNPPSAHVAAPTDKSRPPPVLSPLGTYTKITRFPSGLCMASKSNQNCGDLAINCSN
jgi:hypothetical protein